MSDSPRISMWSDLDKEQRSALLSRPAVEANAELMAGTTAIVNRVRVGGDDALRELTRQYDGVDIDVFRVSDDEIAAALASLNTTQIGAIELAIANVREFHKAQLPASIRVETMPGVVCERISHALDSVGLYVPAGTAPLPSAAVMLAVPAVIAGVSKIVLCTPPRHDGKADPAVLVAASKAGVSEIYKVGGAQAVAALAYGTDSIPRVRKILGPGNSWVTAAKTLVSSDPTGAAIDMPAGPSEVLVIADGNASPEFVAADLLSQAEHGADSQVVLVATDKGVALAVQKQIQEQLKSLGRQAIASLALKHSRIILARNIDEAISISNEYAPEHLILQIDDARQHLAGIRNAGSVFVGRWTPESVGDYCSGTNHVLPTYGYAATYSGLGVDQFLRYMTVQELSREGLEGLGGAVITLAELEGLDAHAAAVSRRLETAE